MQYVLGFAFNEAKNYVVLILKDKPDWQKGNFNGVGGKIEEGELPAAAMAREFLEETGILTYAEEWQPVGKMQGEGWECFVFTMANDELMSARTMTSEEVSVLEVMDIIKGDYSVISNLPFLIELCRDEFRPKNVSIQYAHNDHKS